MPTSKMSLPVFVFARRPDRSVAEEGDIQQTHKPTFV
jgi:hypothetical protein